MDDSETTAFEKLAASFGKAWAPRPRRVTSTATERPLSQKPKPSAGDTTDAKARLLVAKSKT